ncbi:MAG: hypothetical protein JXA17_04985 [Dehalococcoidales bacterium]|nr:hypothetical protein [Dehalococcoidales bacterium]
MVDPLERLLVDREELDRGMLATVLADLVYIDKSSGGIVLTRKAAQFSKKIQLLVYLAGRKAAKALNIIDKEESTPSAIQLALGMSGGTVRGQLSILAKERLVSNTRGSYFLPNYAVEQVKNLLEKG